MTQAVGEPRPDEPDLLRFERQLRAQGFRRIAGVDEAGRGALAGPMVAAAVVLPGGFDSEGIADSKVLTRLQRESCYTRIVAGAASVAVVRVTSAAIDRRGLHRSNLALLRRAVRSLELEPDYVLTDGWPIKRLGVPTLSIKKGDAVTASVAAASIVAKVVRDRAMLRYHRRFPAYGFDRHKGYGTASHWDALERHGPCPIHRRSFKGVAAAGAVAASTGPSTAGDAVGDAGGLQEGPELRRLPELSSVAPAWEDEPR